MSLPTLVEAMRDREMQRRALIDRLRAINAPRGSETDILADLRERLTDWRSLLRDETPKARGLLKLLIVGRLTMTPGKSFYTFKGTGTLLPILAGIVAVAPQSVASPTGFEPVFWP